MALIGAGPWEAVAHAQAHTVADTGLPASVAPYHAFYEAYLNKFRRIGMQVQYSELQANLPRLTALAATGSEAQRAAALIEIGHIELFTDQYGAAADAYGKGGQISARIHRSDLGFEAAIGLFRVRETQKDFGAAEQALDEAIALAGSQPPQEQAYDIAHYGAELYTQRGELEPGLVLALAAQQRAQAPADRANALRDVGDALRQLAQSCDFRPLRDARSRDEPPAVVPPACGRASEAAMATYAAAEKLDQAQGWAAMGDVDRTGIFTVQQARAMRELKQRTFSRAFTPSLFSPRDSAHVLVRRGEDARRNLPTLAGAGPAVAQALSMVTTYDAQLPSDLPTLIVQADAQEARTGRPGAANAQLDKVARALETERTSFFDARRQGTVLDAEAWLLLELTARHLAAHEDEQAFATLESARARGLEDLTYFLRREDASVKDRAWLARQVELDARLGAVEQRITANVVARAALPVPPPELAQWEPLWREQRQHLLERPDLRERLRRAKAPDITLADLRRASTQAGVPVLMYWQDSTNVYGWYVGPHGSELRTIFLPSNILEQKVDQMKRTADPTAAFDGQTARQLYLFLIAPFADLLDARQLIIVPEGDLVDLPFEMLVDPEGRFLIEQKAVSYAPSAHSAYDSLTRPIPQIRQVRAIVDPAIDDGTHEVRALRASGLKLRVVRTDDATPQLLEKDLSGAQSVHLLLHGAFRADEPLLSSLATTLQTSPPVTAADLLAIPLRHTRLVVMSACESGELGYSLSNEIYGLPWAVLAEGAQNVVTSRWLVNGASNSQWMGELYKALAAGASPANAAATAMRVMLKSERSPYYWAAMQVHGR